MKNLETVSENRIIRQNRFDKTKDYYGIINHKLNIILKLTNKKKIIKTGFECIANCSLRLIVKLGSISIPNYNILPLECMRSTFQKNIPPLIIHSSITILAMNIYRISSCFERLFGNIKKKYYLFYILNSNMVLSFI